MKKDGQLSGRLLIRKYAFWAVTLLLLIISLLIIKPFIIALISAFILAYLIKPVHNYLNRKINMHISAFICLLLIVGLLVLPMSIVIGGIITQADALINIDSFNILTEKLSSYAIFEKIDFNTFKDVGIGFLLSLLKSAISQIPSLIIALVIMFFGIYFILINWEGISKDLKAYIPFKDKSGIAKEISGVTKNIVYGYLFIAILEFIVALFGFYLSGVKYYLILPFIIAVFAFIPGIGPIFVWGPTAIYYLISGNYFTALGVLITGLIISLLIETLLLGKIVSHKSKIHPLIFFMGVLGGVPLFGIFGFVIGPLILVYTIKLIHESMNQ